MGEAVVGAVLGAVTSNVVAQIFKLVEKRCELSPDFQTDIDIIKGELRMIHAKKVDQLSGKGDPSAVQSESMETMLDLALDIEDCLDQILHFAEGEGMASKLRHRVKAVGSPPLAAEVKQLMEKLKAASQRNHDYNVNNGQVSVVARQTIAASSTSSGNTTKVEPVGIDKPMQKVLSLLQHNDGRPELKVISIVGFGGSGKSTLAKAVYDCPDVVRQFPCRAWVVASKHGGDTKGLLTALFEELRLEDRAKDDVQQLQEKISNYLRTNRYLIVLDDIKEQRWWEGIISAFPKETTSRIIVTTSIQTVAKFCSGRNTYVHNMGTLKSKHSKELLKAVLNGHLPAGLEESSTSIVNKCDGHPLALVAVANYLLMSEHWSAERDCEQLCRSLGLRMATEDAFKELCEVLLNSYSSLPNGYHQDRHLRNLKTCLLYLCVFPNGCHIRGSRLTRRWFAEKYVHGEHPLCELDVANDYIKKLVDPNIIQPIHSSKNEEVKAWRAHGIMHEFMLHISTSAKFITSHENEERSNYRHLFIQNTSRGGASKVNCHGTSRARGSTSGKEKFRAHSLTICGSAGEAVADFPKCELLRVLDLEECNDLKDEHLDGIHKLWFLRYLSLGGTISRVPREIEKLSWLETLDMRMTKREIELPVKVINLPHLKYLLGRFKLDERKWEKSKPEQYVAKESNLQTVAGFITDNNPGFPKLMTHMNKLRKVKIWCDSTDEALLEAIKKFIQAGIDTGCGDRSLTLCLGNSSGNILTFLDKSLENSYAYLSSLKLHGALSGLTQFEFTTLLLGLRELCLSSTNGLTTNELSNLKKLKYLKYLKLVKISLEDFVIKKGNFPGLLRLCLVQSPFLPTIQDGALQKLISLHILNQNLDGLSGIKMEQHTLLQEIALDSEVNQQTKTKWENAATNHPMRPRVLYLKRVYPDGTDSMVKYIAANRPKSETGSSIMQEERQIPTAQSVSVKEPSSSLEHVRAPLGGLQLRTLAGIRRSRSCTKRHGAWSHFWTHLGGAGAVLDLHGEAKKNGSAAPAPHAEPPASLAKGALNVAAPSVALTEVPSERESILVEVPGLQSSSPKEMKIHREEKEEAMPAAKEDKGDRKAIMSAIVNKETAVNGSNSAAKNTVTTAVDMSCGKGKGNVDEIPENAIQVAKDRELALNFKNLRKWLRRKVRKRTAHGEVPYFQ